MEKSRSELQCTAPVSHGGPGDITSLPSSGSCHRAKEVPKTHDRARRGDTTPTYRGWKRRKARHSAQANEKKKSAHPITAGPTGGWTRRGRMPRQRRCAARRQAAAAPSSRTVAGSAGGPAHPKKGRVATPYPLRIGAACDRASCDRVRARGRHSSCSLPASPTRAGCTAARHPPARSIRWDRCRR